MFILTLMVNQMATKAELKPEATLPLTPVEPAYDEKATDEYREASKDSRKPLPLTPVINEGFAEFAEDTVESSSFPYAQVVGLPNLKGAALEAAAKNQPWGLFIPQDEAEKSGFVGCSDWELVDVEFGEGAKIATTPGYITRSPKFYVIHKSQLEVQKWGENGYRFCGLGYVKGKKTPELIEAEKGEKNSDDKALYRTVTRMLLAFVDENNNLIHETPISITARGGFGGSFGYELREYYKQIDKVYFKAARAAGQKVKGGALNDAAHALCLVDCQLGYHKAEGRNPYVVASARKTPAIDSIGVTKEVDRGRDKDIRKVALTGVDLWALLQRKSSAIGQQIGTWYDEFSKYPEPNMGRDATQEDLLSATVTGRVDDFTFLDTGNVDVVVIDAAGAAHPCKVHQYKLPAALEVGVTATVTGHIKDGSLIAQTMTVAADEYGAAVDNDVEF